MFGFKGSVKKQQRRYEQAKRAGLLDGAADSKNAKLREGRRGRRSREQRVEDIVRLASEIDPKSKRPRLP